MAIRSDRSNTRAFPGVCAQCGVEFMGFRRSQKFCSRACLGRSKVNGQRDPSRATRVRREQTAPGLTRTQREHLLAKWRRQGRTCAYCDAPADTVDHVIPLGRNGDNYEGNLAPACRACNASKCDLLLVEWRLARRGTYVIQPLSRGSWRQVQRQRKRGGAVRGVQQILSACYVCGSLYQGDARTCGDPRCQREHLGRWMRDKYRAAHGIPVDPSQPTAYWRRLIEEAS